MFTVGLQSPSMSWEKCVQAQSDGMWRKVEGENRSSCGRTENWKSRTRVFDWIVARSKYQLNWYQFLGTSNHTIDTYLNLPYKEFLARPRELVKENHRWRCECSSILRGRKAVSHGLTGIPPFFRRVSLLRTCQRFMENTNPVSLSDAKREKSRRISLE